MTRFVGGRGRGVGPGTAPLARGTPLISSGPARGVPAAGPSLSLPALLERHAAAGQAIEDAADYVLLALGDCPATRALVQPPPIAIGADASPGAADPEGRGGSAPRPVRAALLSIAENARVRASIAALLPDAGLAPGRWRTVGDHAYYLDLDAACAERWRLYRLPKDFVDDAPVGEHPSVTQLQHELRRLARRRAWRPPALLLGALLAAALARAGGNWSSPLAVCSAGLLLAAVLLLFGALRPQRLAAEARYAEQDPAGLTNRNAHRHADAPRGRHWGPWGAA